MPVPRIFTSGSYSYLPSVFQYSAGVMAEPGYRLEQIRFKHAVPLQDGFKAVESRLRFLGRPFTAFAHCELRSPKQFDDQGFIDFNKTYVRQLQSWNIYTPAVDGVDAINPVARTNVCQSIMVHKKFQCMRLPILCQALSSKQVLLSRVVEMPEKALNPTKTVSLPLGMFLKQDCRKKMAFVIEEMANRLRSFDLKWSDVTKVQAYSIHNIALLVDELLAKPGLIQHGLTWHFARPPVAGLDYEMDLRGSVNELFSDD